MKLGVVFPQTEIGTDPAAIKDFAQAAEALGYDFLLAYDHVIGANPNRPGGWNGPYTHESPFHEPFVLFAYLAGLTQTIEFTTGIIILPQRQTVLVAKQAAALDVLSGGRIRLGIGIGWNPVEFEALGEDFANRGRRSEEQVALMRELWTKPLVTFRGDYHTVDDAGLNPLPVQRPIPVWFGGLADAVLRRMARIGDGWMMNRATLEQGKTRIATLHGYLEAQGRRPQEFGIDMRISLPDNEHREWGGLVEAWGELGATHINFDTMRAGLKSPQEHIAAIERFKNEVRN